MPKKSYMDRKNILSEGFLQSFIKTIIPQSIKKPIIDKYVKDKKQEIKKLENELQKSYKISDKLYADATKYFKTQGIDLPPTNDKKANKKFWDMVYKEIG